MTDLWTDLVDCLSLRPAGPSAPAGPSVFEGRNQRLSYHRVFGGQILAQFVRAARLTSPEKAVKSLHVLFPRAGRTDEPIRYEVATQHSGSTFATLTIVAHQSRGVVATAAVSMHTPEDGPRNQAVPPVPALPGSEHQVKIDLLPWETRALDDLDATAPAPPAYEMWMRTPPVDPSLAEALAAYGTDLTLIGTALRPMPGVSQAAAGQAFTSAVTSHTVWFHAPFHTDEWLLLRQQSPLVAGARCYGRGDILTESGTLVASYAQEALLRFPE